MSLQFKFDQSVDEVFELLSDPDFLVERSLALGELEADCEVEEYEDCIVIKMARTVEPEMPAFLAKIFGSTQSLDMEETWQRNGDDWEGSYEIKVGGQPVTMEANFSLTADGDGSCYEIEHFCTAKIPLVGRKIEKQMLAETSGGATAELEYLQQKLNG